MDTIYKSAFMSTFSNIFFFQILMSAVMRFIIVHLGLFVLTLMEATHALVLKVTMEME